MLNAPGRLLDNGAEISLQAVLAGSYSQGQILASKLQEINEIRKGLKDSAVSRAFGIIETQGLSGSNPIVLYDEETPEGIVGLVAGSVSEKYNVSSFVFTKKGSMLKGSARTAGYDNLKKSLDAFHLQHGDVLGDTYGGHKGAAGISIKTENFEKFKLYIPQYMEELHKKQDTLFMIWKSRQMK